MNAMARIQLAAGIGAAFAGGDAFQKWMDVVMEQLEISHE